MSFEVNDYQLLMLMFHNAMHEENSTSRTQIYLIHTNKSNQSNRWKSFWNSLIQTQIVLVQRKKLFTRRNFGRSQTKRLNYFKKICLYNNNKSWFFGKIFNISSWVSKWFENALRFHLFCKACTENNMYLSTIRLYLFLQLWVSSFVSRSFQ